MFRGDDDIRVSEGAAGGATRVSGFKRVSFRTIQAISSSHGFDANLCVHEGGSSVVLELVNRTVHSVSAISSGSISDFSEACRGKLCGSGVSAVSGGSCWRVEISGCSYAANSGHLLSDILATTRVIDVWVYCDRVVVLYAPIGTHTGALSHLREQRPELFSPQHCRGLADRRTFKTVARVSVRFKKRKKGIRAA